MNLVETTPPEQTDAISFEVELAHPPEKVWRALTDPALLSRWLLPVEDLELVPGAEFRLGTDPFPRWEVEAVECRVVEADEPRKLSYAWVADELDSVVTFLLEPTESGTRLRLVQSGFEAGQSRNFHGARYGWQKMLGQLADLLSSS